MPPESTGQMNPFDMVLRQIQDLTDETKGHGKMLAQTMIKLDNLKDRQLRMEKTMEKVAEAEWSCPARLNNDRTQKRISKIEALRSLDQTGEISVIRSLPKEALKGENSNPVLTFFAKNWLKLVPWVLLAIIGLLRILQDGDLPTEMIQLPKAQEAKE